MNFVFIHSFNEFTGYDEIASTWNNTHNSIYNTPYQKPYHCIKVCLMMYNYVYSCEMKSRTFDVILKFSLFKKLKSIRNQNINMHTPFKAHLESNTNDVIAKTGKTKLYLSELSTQLQT